MFTEAKEPFEFQSLATLEGQLLVSTPYLKDSCFEKSMIYLFSHDSNGTMGLIINREMEGISCYDVLDQLQINLSNISYDAPIHFGGPVHSSKGLILHSDDYIGDATLSVHDGFAVTSTIDILRDIANGMGPANSIVALGHASWEPGQLEREITENSWLIVPPSEELVFDTDNFSKWHTATSLLSIDSSSYSSAVGHA